MPPLNFLPCSETKFELILSYCLGSWSHVKEYSDFSTHVVCDMLGFPCSFSISHENSIMYFIRSDLQNIQRGDVWRMNGLR